MAAKVRVHLVEPERRVRRHRPPAGVHRHRLRAAEQLEPKVRLLKLNADNAPSVSSRLGISGIPTLLLMQGGREISRTSGAMDTQKIVAWTMAGLTRSQ